MKIQLIFAQKNKIKCNTILIKIREKKVKKIEKRIKIPSSFAEKNATTFLVTLFMVFHVGKLS